MPRELRWLHARKEMWPRGLRGRPENNYYHWRFSTQSKNRRKRRRAKESGEKLLDVTPLLMLALCQATLGWEVEKSLSCSSLAKMRKLRW